jgi:hypothetical protein
MLLELSHDAFALSQVTSIFDEHPGEESISSGMKESSGEAMMPRRRLC